jgi:hypothetical protein
MLPAKAEPDAQARFVVEELEPRLAQARAGQRAVFFVDAVHFVLAPFLFTPAECSRTSPFSHGVPHLRKFSLKSIPVPLKMTSMMGRRLIQFGKLNSCRPRFGPY